MTASGRKQKFVWAALEFQLLTRNRRSPIEENVPTVAMKNRANKNLLILAVIMGGFSSIVFVWARLPTETLAETLKLLAIGVVAWLMISVLAFIVFWIFYKLIFGIGGYLYDRFYRTPTL